MNTIYYHGTTLEYIQQEFGSKEAEYYKGLSPKDKKPYTAHIRLTKKPLPPSIYLARLQEKREASKKEKVRVEKKILLAFDEKEFAFYQSLPYPSKRGYAGYTSAMYAAGSAYKSPSAWYEQKRRKIDRALSSASKETQTLVHLYALFGESYVKKTFAKFARLMKERLPNYQDYLEVFDKEHAP